MFGSKMTNHPDIGTEFDWIASDKEGRIALMSTAGYGNCPKNASQCRDQADDIIDWILIECGLKNIDLLLARPEKGVIIYDWAHWHGPYKRKYLPKHCIDRNTILENNLPIEAVFSLNVDFLDTEEIPDEII
jgi:hypothetical protein